MSFYNIDKNVDFAGRIGVNIPLSGNNGHNSFPLLHGLYVFDGQMNESVDAHGCPEVLFGFKFKKAQLDGEGRLIFGPEQSLVISSGDISSLQKLAEENLDRFANPGVARDRLQSGTLAAERYITDSLGAFREANAAARELIDQNHQSGIPTPAPLRPGACAIASVASHSVDT